MSLNWVNALDACAAAGVLDYDASADLMDAPARFVGRPTPEQISLLPNGTKMKKQPKKDTFEQSSNINRNPRWKKILFGILLAGGTVALIFCRKGKGKGLGKKLGTFGANVWNFIKKPFVALKKKIKP